MFRARIFRDGEHLKTLYFGDGGTPPDDDVNVTLRSFMGEVMGASNFVTWLLGSKAEELGLTPKVGDIIYADDTFYCLVGNGNWQPMMPSHETSELYSKAMRRESQALTTGGA